MKTPRKVQLLLFIVFLVAAPAVYSQEATSRDKTKDRLNALLTRVGPTYNITFKATEKSPYTFVGQLKEGLTNCDYFEIVITATKADTIGFRIFPHYKAAYINIDKVRNTVQLLRKIAQLNDSAFLFWGADDTGDVFCAYTFTLESGFPDKAIEIVLSSIKNSDKFVGEMRPSIDGTNAP
jgi:hypothetical protein